jgi:hypothetical protein
MPNAASGPVLSRATGRCFPVLTTESADVVTFRVEPHSDSRCSEQFGWLAILRSKSHVFRFRTTTKGSLPMRIGFAVARLASAAWVGAAVLFVVTALREVRHPGFDSATKDTLALLRFPAYYAFGFILISVALAGAVLALAGRARAERRRIVGAAWLLGLVLLLMVVDFVAIYLPIVGLLTPVGRARPAEFIGYHRASIAINVCGVALCGLAAALLCWQSPRDETLPPT